MKFSLIVAVVVLALAQGSFAQQAELEAMSQYIEGLKAQFTELVQSQDFAGQAQTFMEDRKTQLEPMAAEWQEKLKEFSTNFEDQIKPMAANAQAQMQPMVEKLQEQVQIIMQKLAEHSKAITN